MESVTIIFSMFRLVTVGIFSSGVRYALIIAKVRVVCGKSKRDLGCFDVSSGMFLPKNTAMNIIPNAML